MTVGGNIKRIRKEKGLTQRKLGELCGINEVQIRRYELGGKNANPKLETLSKIAQALEVDITDLMDLTPLMNIRKDDFPSYEFNNIESSLPSGYSLGGNYAEGELWLIYPDNSTVSVSMEELEDVIADCESYMEYKLQALKKKL